MSHISSTQTIPEHTSVPRHVAVIMDGNGRWAKKRLMPRVMGHKKGLDVLENICHVCNDAGVRYLTVFAFSTENWRRPADEVRRSGIDARRLPDILGCGVFSKQVGVCRASMSDLRQQFVFTIVSEYQTRFPPARE